MRRLLFVVGPPRSGTSVVAWLLSQHPLCRITFESHWPLIVNGWDPTCGTRPDMLKVAEALADAWGVPEGGVFGDKSPSYCEKWRQLKQEFPKCRFVMTSRDYEETVQSVLRQDWGCDDPGAREWVHRCILSLDGIQDALHVSLETLNEDLRQGTGLLLDWVGLDHESYPWDAALEYVRTTRIN